MSRYQLTTASSNELQEIFDEQLEKMFGLIDQQLQIVQNSHPHEYIVSVKSRKSVASH